MGALAIAGLVLSVAVAACGGGGDSASTGSAGSSQATTTETSGDPSSGSEAVSLATAPNESEPTKIKPGIEPLPKPPPKGLNLIILQCDFPVCEIEANVMREGGANLGWNVKTTVFKTGSPQSAVTQAVNAPGAEYIAIPGVPRSLIEPQIKVAEEKGIKFITASNPEPPHPPAWAASISQYNSSAAQEGIARWIINDSGGKANIALVSYPEIPITAAEGPAVEKVIEEEECPECKFAEIPITGEELAAGTVPAKVVAYLQSHPEVDYLQTAFNSVLTGIPQALKSAGFGDKVRVTSINTLEAPEAAMLANGEVAAYNIVAEAEHGAMALDAVARLAEGLPLPQSEYALSQYWLCTPATATKCKGWTGPPDLLRQYEELWGIK